MSTPQPTFGDRLTARVRQVGAATCVGFDPHLARLPEPLAAAGDRVAVAAAVERFFLGVIEAVAPRAAAVKPQVAFFEQLGAPGVAALERLCAEARSAGLLVVLDAKRGDIGTTAEAYAVGALDDDGPIGADAVTLSPYLGPESMAPFLARRAAGKGVFVLVRTSNPGAGAWQVDGEGAIAPRVAAWIAGCNADAAGYGDVGAVVAATAAGEAATWRARMPRTWFLVPGYGAQGGTAEDLRGLAGADGLGALVNSSRAVLFPQTGRDGADWKARIRDRADAFAGELADVLAVR